jgi:hypothetical protein
MKKKTSKSRIPKEQEEREILKYQQMSPNEKIIELEKIRKEYMIKKYGYIPKFRRIAKIVKRKKI